MGFSTPRAPAIQQITKAWVDDDDPTCGGNSPCFKTIQAAIDAIQLGPYQSGTAYIRPGLYREHVQITKDVELEGAGRELVRLEAPDQTKPAILIKGTYSGELSGLGIFGGSVGILIEDAEVFEIARNRIAGYTQAGIRLTRAKISSGIHENELPDQWLYLTQMGIEIGEGSNAEIEANVIRSYLKIDGKESTAFIGGNILQGVVVQQGEAAIVRNHLIGFSSSRWGVGIFITGAEASASIIANQIQGYEAGIALKRGKAHIKSNLISTNEYGIAIGDPSRPAPEPPQFEIVRNRIVANRQWGLVVYEGQGVKVPLIPLPPTPRAQIRNNVISENGFDYYADDSGGVQFWPRSRLDFSNNWVINNTSGICPYFDYRENPIDPEALVGKDNEIRDNTYDTCLFGNETYPWPPGFRK